MKRTKVTLLGLLLALGIFVQTTTAQYLPTHLPTDACVTNVARVPLLLDDGSTIVPMVEQVGAIGMTVSDMDSRLVSPGAVALNDRSLGFSKGLLARDPDGHVMALIER